MTREPNERIASLENETENQKERLKKLEDNQRWGVMTILALVGNSIFQWLQRGGQP